MADAEPPGAARNARRARQLSLGRRDLAALCFERALGEWVELALTAEMELGSFMRELHRRMQQASGEAGRGRLNERVRTEYMLQLLDWHHTGGWVWLTLLAEGRLAAALNASGLDCVLQTRLQQSVVRSFARACTRRARGLQLVRPDAAELSIDAPALLVLLELLEGRSRMLAWSRRERLARVAAPG